MILIYFLPLRKVLVTDVGAPSMPAYWNTFSRRHHVDDALGHLNDLHCLWFERRVQHARRPLVPSKDTYLGKNYNSSCHVNYSHVNSFLLCACLASVGESIY
jgi:hypothetical protein